MNNPIKILEGELYIKDYQISSITNDYTEISDYTSGGEFKIPTLEAVANSLFDLSSKTVDKLIVNPNTLYVSGSKGDNNTAIKGNIHRSYQTIQAAYSAATAGDMIYVFRDDYNVDTNLAKNGVDYYFEPGVNVSSTTTLFYYLTTYSTSITYDINILGYGNFYCNDNGVFYITQDDTQITKYPVNVNVNVEFNIANGFIALNSQSQSNTNVYFYNIRGKYLYRNGRCVLAKTFNINVNIDIDVVYGITSDSDGLVLLYTTNKENGENNIYYKSNRTINTNINYPAIYCSSSKIDVLECSFIKSYLSYINCGFLTRMDIIGSSTIYIKSLYGIMNISNAYLIDINTIYCGFISTLNINGGGKHIIFGSVNNVNNNSVDSTLLLYSNMDISNGNWNLNNGINIINGDFTNNGDTFTGSDRIIVNGNAKVYLNATVNLKHITPQRYTFLNITHPDAYVEVNGNISLTNVMNAINLTNGKLLLQGNIIMNNFNNLEAESAIIYDGGDLTINGSVIKVVNDVEQYPISCRSIDRNIKILNRGLCVNKSIFASIKKKVEVYFIGTLQSSQTYNLTLNSIPYDVSGVSSYSEACSAFTFLLSSQTSDYLLVNKGNTFTVEASLYSNDFNITTTQSAGTGSITYFIVQYKNYLLTNSTGGTIITDSDI